MRPLDGRIAIVTGGAGSVGSAIVRKLAAQGATVLVNCFHSYPRAKEMVAQLRAEGADAHVLRGSVAKIEQVHRMFDEVAREYGRLDILVNNAAFGAFGWLDDVESDDFQRSLDTNLKGPMWCMRAARPLMVAAGGGAIVNVSSIGTTHALGGYLMIAAAKAGLETATRYLAVELGRDNIRVNVAAGGLLDNATIDAFPDPEDMRTNAREHTPLGRLGLPEDLANTVAMLVSPESAWVSGQTVVADGGVTMLAGGYRNGTPPAWRDTTPTTPTTPTPTTPTVPAASAAAGAGEDADEGDPIAVVSMGVAVPGASTPEAFWELLNSGGELFTEAPEDRWSAADFAADDPSAPDKTYQSRAGFIRNFVPHDRLQREIAAGWSGADPQTVWLRHCLYQAWENTSTTPADQVVLCLGVTSTTSQFAEESAVHGLLRHALDSGELGEFSPVDLEQVRKALDGEFEHAGGALRGFLPLEIATEAGAGILPDGSRIRLVDAACASALYALDLGIRDIRSGRADVAVCGGVEALTPASQVLFSKLRGLSVGGGVRALDRAADGVLFADAAAVVVLKRLSKALADGDRVHGVIAGVGLSTDGRGKAIHTPASDGQLIALRRAFDGSAVRPDDIDLVVAHSTGTMAGDLAEVTALRQAYATGSRVWVTSNKSLIGHGGWAAGAVSLIHLLLALREHTIPPQHRFTRGNRAFDGQTDSDLAVPVEPVTWPSRAGDRAGAVSSMGFGGTNAHVLVRQRHRSGGVPEPARGPVRLAVVGWSHAEDTAPAEALRVPGTTVRRMDRAQLLTLNSVLALDEPVRRACVRHNMAAGVVIGHGGLPRNYSLSAVRTNQDRIRRALADVHGDADLFGDRLAGWIDGLMPEPNEDTMTGGMVNIVASRVAQQLDLKGLSLAVDGADGPLAEAIDVAASYLASGDLDIVLAGEVNGNTLPGVPKPPTGGSVEAASVFAIAREDWARAEGLPVLATFDSTEPLPPDGPWRASLPQRGEPGDGPAGEAGQDRYETRLEARDPRPVRPRQPLIPPETAVLTGDTGLLAGWDLPAGTAVLSPLDEAAVASAPTGVRHVRVFVDLAARQDTVLAVQDQLLLAAQACGSDWPRVEDLVVVLLGGISAAGVPHPLTGLYTGMVRSLELELPAIRVLAVVHDGTDLAAVRADVETETATDRTLPVAYYAGGRRLVEVLRSAPARPASPPLTRDSVVVSAGGGHGIGAEMLKGLARSVAPRLYVLGSTDPAGADRPVTDRRQYIAERTTGPDRVSVAAAIAEYERWGRARAVRETLAELARYCGPGRVTYLCCDLRDQQRVREVIAEVLDRESGVDLVLHTAGTGRFTSLRRESVAAFREIRDSKVHGYLNLVDAFGPRRPRRWVNVGSVVATIGLRGGVAYSAANGFLDTAAKYASSQGHYESSIGFGVWGGAGFAASPEIQEIATRVALTVTPVQEGVAQFLTELGQPAPVNPVMGNRAPAPPFGELRDVEVTTGPALPYFIDEVVDSDDEHLVAVRDFDVRRDGFLDQHEVSGHPTLPAALTLEMAAEAACLLVPGQVPIALTDVTLGRFVRVFRDRGPQRKKITARRLGTDAGQTSVRVVITQDVTAPDGTRLTADQELAAATVLLRPHRGTPPVRELTADPEPAPVQVPRIYDVPGAALNLSGIFASTQDPCRRGGRNSARLRLDGAAIAELLPNLVLPAIMLDGLFQTTWLAGEQDVVSAPYRIGRLDVHNGRNDVALASAGVGVTFLVDTPRLDRDANRVRASSGIAVTDDGTVLAGIQDYEGAVLRSAGARPARTAADPRTSVGDFEESVRLRARLSYADTLVGRVPYFDVHDGVVAGTTRIDGRELLAFSSYNYLNLSGHPDVTAAANAAAEAYGTSASASRAIADRPPLVALERNLAGFLGTPSALVVAGGFLTNVTVLDTLVGAPDLVVHDSLAHVSITRGAALSGATVRSFPHNDMSALDRFLGQFRERYRRVLIVVEGVYSVHGDLVDLPALVEVKRRHGAMVMIDEAHSMGVVGDTGRGVAERFGVARGDIDVWMGTLSKAFASFGGYIAGSNDLIELLKYTATGFQFSASLPPSAAAAADAALRILAAEPDRVAYLRRNATLFRDLAERAGLNIGPGRDSAVIPCVIGDERATAILTNRLRDRGIDANPMLHPIVPVGQECLRFFVNTAHTEEQIRTAVEVVSHELGRIGD